MYWQYSVAYARLSDLFLNFKMKNAYNFRPCLIYSAIFC